MKQIVVALLRRRWAQRCPRSRITARALFEPEKLTTVTGTVTEFQFVNPHVLVYLNVKGADGKEVRWGGELTSPNRLARMNGDVKWSRDIVKPGDTLTITGHGARNGAPLMDITKIVDAKGVVLIDG